MFIWSEKNQKLDHLPVLSRNLFQSLSGANSSFRKILHGAKKLETGRKKHSKAVARVSSRWHSWTRWCLSLLSEILVKVLTIFFIRSDLILGSYGVDGQPHFSHLHFVKVLLSHFPSISPSEEFPQDNEGIFHPTAAKWEDRRKVHFHRDLKIIMVNQFKVFVCSRVQDYPED